ncbi:hypothetical protein GS221_004001 [Salmonella enterica]|nr:hypothetical protein [Salmonella enterica]
MIKNVYKGCAFTGGNSSYSDNAYLDFLFIIDTYYISTSWGAAAPGGVARPIRREGH